MNNKNNLNKALENNFNPKKWKAWKMFSHYKYTGFNLIDEINKLDPDLVIDVGCGHNRFKGHIKNLIGFDQEPFPFVDIVSSIENINFRPESADVVMALGSIQFGNRDFVRSQMKKITSWVKPGGFIVMRTMGEWYRELDREWVKEYRYIWSPEDIIEIGNENNLNVYKGIFIEDLTDIDQSNRLAWWYRKPGELKKYKIDPETCEIGKR